MPETPPINTPFYLDKSLWLAVLAPFLGLLSKRLGISLDPQEVVGMVLPIVAFIVLSKWKAATLQKAQIQADAAKAAVTDESTAASVLRGP